MLLFPQQGLFLRQPADGRGVKNDFRPLHGRQARGFRVPLIPADEHADAAESGVERLIAQVAGGEVKFFFKPGILRNMHLAVHAQERTVRIHHPGGIVVKPGGALFKAGGNNHHAQFRRQFPVGFRQFPGNRFRQVE